MAVSVNKEKFDAYSLNVNNTYYAPSKTVSNDTEVSDELSGKTKVKKKKTDEKKINRAGSFLKGIGNFFKGLVCDEEGNFSLTQTLKTVAIGALVAGASILIPGAGTAIVIGALAIAGKHLVSSAIDIYNAETEDEINLAYENMGSSVTEAALAATGAKATGAFKTIGKAGKAAKTAGADMYSSYKAGGVKGLKAEAQYQGNNAIDGIKNTYHSTVDGTKANLKNLTNSETKHQNTLKSYDEKIAKAKTKADKNAIKAEKQAYENGYNKVATETDYTKAYEALKQIEADLEKARKAATKKGASDKAKSNYRKLLAEHEAASKTLKARANKGDFKSNKSNLKKIQEKTNDAYNEMVAKRNALRTAKESGKDVKKAQAEYDKAFDAYRQATSEEFAAKGKTSKRYILSQAVGEGAKQRPVQLMTLTLAGRGKEDTEYVYEYVA